MNAAAASASKDDANVKKKQAETDFKVAKARCKEMTGVEAKICQRDAKSPTTRFAMRSKLHGSKATKEKAAALQNDNVKRQAATRSKGGQTVARTVMQGLAMN